MHIVLPLVAGLQMRFGWVQGLSITWHSAGVAVFALGWGFSGWAMVINAYVWSEVPVQEGQTVCSSGPYRLVRHPAYAGMGLQALGAPILLGALWALIPGLVAVACLVIATAWEDRLLQTELPGYRDYTQRVPFRLIPGIW